MEIRVGLQSFLDSGQSRLCMHIGISSATAGATRTGAPLPDCFCIYVVLTWTTSLLPHNAETSAIRAQILLSAQHTSVIISDNAVLLKIRHP